MINNSSQNALITFISLLSTNTNLFTKRKKQKLESLGKLDQSHLAAWAMLPKMFGEKMNTQHKKKAASRLTQLKIKSHLFLLFVLLFVFSGPVSGGLKIYYIRHAEGGHNVKKAWEAKGIPKSEWPSYVGNPDEFTPKGKQELLAATEKLKAYKFDFIASSPIWRARNTILPYLKISQNKSEVWPELREGPGMVTILSKNLPEVKEKILNQGAPISLPKEEQEFFILRDDAKNNYSKYPKDSDENLKVAYMKHVTLNAIKVIEKRFGGTNKSILLAGHNSAGVSLLKLLLKSEPKNKRGLINTGIWMVEQQKDGSYLLKIYNDEVL